MALVDVDSWITEYESCARLNRTIIKQLNQRDSKINNSPDYNRLTLSVQVGLKQFDRELQQLKLKLSDASSTRTITFEEASKRQRDLETLQSQRIQVQALYTNPKDKDRIALFESTRSSSAKDTTSPKVAGGGDQTGEDSDAAPILNTTLDVQRLQQYKADMMQEQDQSLENLSQTISRQRAITLQFGQEIEEQNDILDNLANTIERVEGGVSLETQNISLVSRRDSTFGYWVVIIILFIAIVIVSLV